MVKDFLKIERNYMFRSNNFIRGYFNRNNSTLEKQYYEFIDELDDGSYFDYDLLEKVFYCGKKFAESLGIKQVLINFPQCLKSMNIISAHELNLIAENKEYSKDTTEREICFLNSEGKKLWYLLRYKAILNNENIVTNVVGKFINITKYHSDLAFLTAEVQKDKLTGLLNKYATEQRIEALLKTRLPNEKSALFLIDIDNFKQVNDSFGHLYGDTVLINLSECLSKVFRQSDVVGRIGGDEFFIFIQNYGDDAIVKRKAEEIKNSFTKRYQLQDKFIDVSVSIGIAYTPERPISLSYLYDRADIALYQAKNKGKNQYIIYDETQTRSQYLSERVKNKNKPMQKKFEENTLEYVFKLLYSSDNFENIINSVLHLLTEYFGFTRGYIYEFSEDLHFETCAYEWCKKGFISTKQDMQNIPISNIGPEGHPALKDECFIFNEKENFKSDKVKLFLETYKIQYVINFGIWDGKKPMGFVGFSDSEKTHSLSEEQIDEIGNICKLIGVFLTKHIYKKRIKSMKKL